jgi:hypothetical protein
VNVRVVFELIVVMITDKDDQFSFIQKNAIVDCIRRNNGVVCAEMIAPLATPGPIAARTVSNTVNENWMLPILLDLGGTPFVTRHGTIAYAFKDVVNDAGRAPTDERLDRQHRVLLEESSRFSENKATQNIWAVFVGTGIFMLSNILLAFTQPMHAFTKSLFKDSPLILYMVRIQ